MHLVSVVIPGFNRAGVIEEAIRSVQSQTHQDWEILVVDDASKDATSSVVKRLADEDKRIKYLRHQTNQGAQAARNTGIRASVGQWIAFLDSDDRWLPNSVKVRLQMALQSNKKVVHSECLVITAEAGTRPFKTPNLAGRIYKKLLRKPGPTFPSLFVSRDCLHRIGYLDESVVAYQEWDTAIRLAKHYEFAFIPDPTFIYDCRNSDSISKSHKRGAAGYEQVFTKHRWAVVRHLGPRALVSHYQTAAELYRAANDEQNASRCLRKAFLWWPFRARTLLKRLQRAAAPES